MAVRRRFEDVQEGDELPVRSLFLSKDQVRAYARAGGQWSPRFTDDEGARREGLPGMIAPGNLSMGLLASFRGVGGAGHAPPARDDVSRARAARPDDPSLCGRHAEGESEPLHRAG